LDRLCGASDLINLDGSDLIPIWLKTKRTDPSDLDLTVENESLTSVLSSGHQRRGCGSGVRWWPVLVIFEVWEVADEDPCEEAEAMARW
jgi:hypothetical protein